MKKARIQITASILSTFRSELMGIGILGVLIGHFYNLSQLSIHPLIDKLLQMIPTLVFTQGFLLLSGFGLYYSFSKNSNLPRYYYRRCRRLLFPYMLMTLPFLLWFLYLDGNLPLFLGKLTTAAFWFVGNYCGMWYVAITLVFYLVFPFLYKFLFLKDGYLGILFRLFVSVIVLVTVAEMLRISFPDYYEVVSIGVSKTWLLPVGMYWGWVSRHSILWRSSQVAGVLSFSLLLVLALFVAKHYSSLYSGYYACALRLLTIPVLCLLMNGLKGFSVSEWLYSVLRWLGIYSLELYILHLFLYVFLSYWFSPAPSVIIAIILSLLLCLPVHKAVEYVLNIKPLPKGV